MSLSCDVTLAATGSAVGSVDVWTSGLEDWNTGTCGRRGGKGGVRLWAWRSIAHRPEDRGGREGREGERGDKGKVSLCAC